MRMMPGATVAIECFRLAAGIECIAAGCMLEADDIISTHWRRMPWPQTVLPTDIWVCVRWNLNAPMPAWL